MYSVGPNGELIGTRTDYDILPPLADGRPDYSYLNPSPDFKPTPTGWVYTGSRDGFTAAAVEEFVRENMVLLAVAGIGLLAVVAMGGRKR